MPHSGRAADVNASREVLEAYRLVAADAGWLSRVGDVIRGGADRRGRGAAGRRRTARPDAPHHRPLSARTPGRHRGSGRPAAGGAGRRAARTDGAAGAILLARRLGPAELLDWHARGIAGVAIEEASPAGHAAILARALGLPPLGGLRGMLDSAETGDEAVVDADEGQLMLRPETEVRDAYTRALEARTCAQAGLGGAARPAGRHRRRHELKLMLNVGLRMELAQLERTGADGIGLFRTEIAMLARGVGRRCRGTGGDLRPRAGRGRRAAGAVPHPGPRRRQAAARHDAAEEENPAMGWRSLRVGLDRPALLRRQLRALLLAAGGRRAVGDVPDGRDRGGVPRRQGAAAGRGQRVRPAPRRLQIGTMLEMPALMWQLPDLLAEADFISVGTNDLLQFLFAADRGTPALSERYDLLSPPVLDMLDQVVAAARQPAVPVSVCGEAASRPLEALALAGLGITTLSMPARGILPIKAMLAGSICGSFRAVLAAIRARRRACQPA